ncbi:hypothetical protein J7L67_07970, partial [bacterium]|nr:hypothetical protein [bacterium]
MKKLYIFLIISIIYVVVTLVNGKTSSFFEHNVYGSKYYANVWEHLQKGDFYIDKKCLPYETFITPDNKRTSYFGIMPAFIRGFFDPFMDIYSINLSNLSILIAIILSLLSIFRTAVKLNLHKGNTRFLLMFSLIAIIFASPLTYNFTWAWLYHEILIWGFAWTTIFMSAFLLWVFKKDTERNILNGLIMGVSVGLAVLSRPSVALTAAIAYGCLCVYSLLFSFIRRKQVNELKTLSYGIIICALCAVLTLTINYKKWGNPLTFIKMEQHEELIHQDRAKAFINKTGYFNPNRFGYSLIYYFMPSKNNFKTTFPFFQIDSELNIMKNHPHYDYIEGSRMPLTLCALYLLLISTASFFIMKNFNRKEKLFLLFFILGGLATSLSLIGIYCLALRYSLDFMPFIIFLNMIFLIGLKRGKINRTVLKKINLTALFVLIISVYISTLTMFNYKIFNWGIPWITKFKIAELINYIPSGKEVLWIRNGKKTKHEFY